MPQCRHTGTGFTGQTGGAAVGASGARPTHSIADGPRKETAKETAKETEKPCLSVSIAGYMRLTHPTTGSPHVP